MCLGAPSWVRSPPLAIQIIEITGLPHGAPLAEGNAMRVTLVVLSVASLIAGCVAPPTPAPQNKPTMPTSDGSKPPPTPNPTPQPQSPPQSPKTGCNGIPTRGTCLLQNGHQLLRSCDATTNMPRPDTDCTALNEICGYDTQQTASCQVQNSTSKVPSTGAGTCPSVTYAGTCSADQKTLTYCNNGTVKVEACASGYSCTVVSGDANCRVNSTTTGTNNCGSVTYAGTCSSDGSTLTFCDGGTLTVSSCPASAPCTVINGDANCRVPGANNCNGITWAGQCSPDNTYVLYCDFNGILQTTSCDDGTTCVKDASTGNSRCL
jgi:hypothetical protein